MSEPSHHARLRERLSNLLALPRAAAEGARRVVDVVVSHVEICDKHGTGVLTQRLFGDQAGMVAVRGRDHYGGVQRFGEAGFLLTHGDGPRPDVYRRVLETFSGYQVGRVVAIPFYPDDVWTAIALKDAFGARLCTWVMDDQNHDANGIPDPLLRELLEKSELRLAISLELREAYERKFGLRHFVLPPLAPEPLVRTEPTPAPAAGPGARRGVMIGNVWGSVWMENLCATLAGTGVQVDWHTNGDLRWMRLGREEMAAAGVTLREGLPEPALAEVLRRAPFVVHPTGLLDEADTHRCIARLSLPSKMPFVLACSHTPTLVLGHPDTAAARFVRATGTGLAIPYERRALLDAVDELCAPATQVRLRRRAAELAGDFSARGAGDWLWRSLELGRAADDRFERLLAPPGSSSATERPTP